jgi:hyperosmotically inducible periplasmic protein
MKTRHVVGWVLLAAVSVPTAILAQERDDSDRSHPTHWVKDSAITTAIKSKLAAEHFGSLTKLSVDTDLNGVVRLSGTANSKEEASRAVAIARSTEGVVRVKNDIVVQPDNH